MTDTAIATAPRAPIERAEPKRPRRLGGKLASAIAAMVWQGMPYDEAARTAELTTRAMRKALDKPHVRAFLKEQRHVFREAASARNIHRLVDIRDAANNMPAVQAIRALEQLGDEQTAAGRGLAQVAGFVIQIINQAPGDAKPLIHHGPVRIDDTEQG